MIEKIRRAYENNPRLYIFTIVGFLFIFFMIIGLAVGRPSSKTGGDLPSPNSGAFMVFQGKSYLPFDDNVMNTSLNDDLVYYARTVYLKEFGNKKLSAVVFNVSGDPKTEGNILQFSGNFEKAKGDITVKVERLKNRRIKTTITNTKSDKNIDSELPSNSKINQFIGTLPIEAADYNIDYSDNPVVIVITLSSLNSENQKTALDIISGAMGADFINDKNIDIFYLDASASEERGVYIKSYINEPDPGDDIGAMEGDEGFKP